MYVSYFILLILSSFIDMSLRTSSSTSIQSESGCSERLRRSLH